MNSRTDTILRITDEVVASITMVIVAFCGSVCVTAFTIWVAF